MKSLSQALIATPKSGPDGLPQTGSSYPIPKHGSTKNAGTAMIHNRASSQDEAHSTPLTASQITNVASLAQSLGLEVAPETKDVRRYDEAVGEERYEPVETGGWDVRLKQKPDEKQTAILRAACRSTIPSAMAIHLGKLALHKRIVKLGEKGVEALVQDYATRLSGECFFEVAVVEAINEIINTSESDFFPQYAVIRKLAEKNTVKYKRALELAETSANPKPQITAPAIDNRPIHEQCRAIPKEKWGEAHWRHYISEAGKMAEIHRKQQRLNDMEDWIRIAAERRNMAILAGVAA